MSGFEPLPVLNRGMVFLFLFVAAQDSPGDDRPGRVDRIVAAVDPHRLRADVEKLVSFRTRNTFSRRDAPAEGIGAAARWTRARFEAIAKSAASRTLVDEHRFRLHGTECRNVFLWFRGTRHPRKVIVHGAHIDTINRWAPRDPNAPAPGANDNASGTAAVLEAARLFAPWKFDVGLIFVAFSGEEYGLHGARAFAAFLDEMDIDVVAMINTDTIGGSRNDAGEIDDRSCRCFSGGPVGSPHRTLARTIKFLVERHLEDLEVRLQNRIDRPGRGGDHEPFTRRGMPAVRLIASHEELRRQHTPDDLPRYMDWAYLGRMTRAMAAVLANLAAGPPPPGRVRIEKNTIAWTPSPGAARYLVFLRRGGSNTVDRVIRAREPRVTVRDLERGDAAFVAAVRRTNEVGPPSAEAVAR